MALKHKTRSTVRNTGHIMAPKHKTRSTVWKHRAHNGTETQDTVNCTETQFTLTGLKHTHATSLHTQHITLTSIILNYD